MKKVQGVLLILLLMVFTGCGGCDDLTALCLNDDYTSPNIGTLKYVPPGSFQRDATAENISVISTCFRMSQHEITRGEFEAVMGKDPTDTTYSTGMSDPVQRVNWYHTIAFCNKLSILE